MQSQNRSSGQDEFSHLGRDTLRELRVRRVSPMPGTRNAYDELKRQVLQVLTADLGPGIKPHNRAQSKIFIQERLDALLAEENIILKQHEKRRLTTDVMAELLGFGPLEPLLGLDGVDQILVNGPKDIFIVRQGQHRRAEAAFEDDAHLGRLIARIATLTGQDWDQDSPVVETEMADGTHVHIMLSAAAANGPLLTIKRAAAPDYTIELLCGTKMVAGEIVDFLQAAVTARLNIVITGQPGTGKTTLLRALCSFIPTNERIVTIEQRAELHLDRDQVIAMETRPATGGEKSDISAETLIMATSRMRPDRLILGSIEGNEAFAWLQLINAGLDGSMTTCNGKNAQDLLQRIELMALLGGPMTPRHHIRSQIVTAVDLIVHLEKWPDNSYSVVSISEVNGYKEGYFVTKEIFRIKQAGLVDSQILGTLHPTGAYSHCAQRIRDAGIPLPAALGI